MKTYVEIGSTKKLALLKDHSINTGWKSLKETKWCLHCEKEFSGKSVRVFHLGGHRSSLWLECGTPGCDGSPIDWADYPWWDENHPMTKAHDLALGEVPNQDESTRFGKN